MRTAWVGIVMLAALAACDKGRPKDCATFRTATYQAQDRMSQAPTVEGTGADIARTAAAQAAVMDEISALFTAMDIHDGTLARLRTEDATIASRKAAWLRELQATGERDDTAAFEALRAKGDALDREEDAVSDKIRAYCHY